MKNFQINLFPDNEKLYSHFQQSIQSSLEKGDFKILKEEILIFTRENYTAENLKLILVKNGIPSLAFQAMPIRNGILQFVPDFWVREILMSDLSGVLLFKHILDQRENSKLSERVTLKIAEDLFREREKSILSQEVISSSHLYKYAFDEFERMKKNRKTYSENLKFHFLELPFQISETIIERVYQRRIFIYALSEIDLLTFRILNKLSNYFQLNYFLTSIPFCKNLKKEGTQQFDKHIMIPTSNIFQFFLKEKSLNPFSELKELPKIRFLQAPEIRREVEYVGRSIYKKIFHHKSDLDFNLFQIKIIIPKSELYAQTIKEVFGELKIPVSCTFDSSVKLAPYYSIVLAIIRFAESNYESILFRDILNNPCFQPQILKSIDPIPTDLWVTFLSLACIEKFLDSEHRIKAGVLPEDYLSWDRGWRILARKIIGIDDEGAILNDEIDKEEALKFIRVSSSFIYDLQYLKENPLSLKEKAEFFQLFLQTYISSSALNLSGEEELSYYDKNAERLIFSILMEMAEADGEIEALGDIDFLVFSGILKEKMNNIRIGNSGILKKGVVVGTNQDTSDAVFRYLYVLGADESNFSSHYNMERFLADESRSHEKQKDADVLNKLYFYKIFQHKPAEIAFSYVGIDSVRDSPVYPYSELEDFRTNYYPKSEWERIPLFGVQELLVGEVNDLLWETNIKKLASMKHSESTTEYLRFANPEFDIENNKLRTEIQTLSVGNDQKIKIENYFLRKNTEPIKNFQARRLFNPVRDIIKYIECPQKYFFERNLDLDEEIIFQDESFETNKSLKNEILKKMVLDYLSNPSSEFHEIFPESLLVSHFEKGNIPAGIPGIIELEAWRNYFKQYLPGIKESIIGKYQIVQEIRFGERFVKLSRGSYIVNSPSLLDVMVGQGPDLFLFTDSLSLSVTMETSPRKKADKPHLRQFMRSTLFALSILKTQKTLDDIQKITGSRVVVPAILRIPLDSAPFLIMKEVDSPEEKLFELFYKEFIKGNFPASPLDTKSPPCEYCGMKEVCLSKISGFEEFLETEKVSLLNYIGEDWLKC